MYRSSISICRALMLLAGLTTILPCPAQAQEFPNRPITIVVPFPPAGPTDIMARNIADKMRSGLKQSVLVENRPGAASLVALNYIRTRPADGYTMVMMSNTITTLPWLNANANYSVARDFTAIAGIGRIPMLVAVHKDTGIDSLAVLFAQARANPGKLNWGVAGNFGVDHLAALRIMAHVGVKIDTIPYQGVAPLTTDLLANRVQISAGSPGLFMQHISSGILRPLAVTGSSRWPDLPNVPTLSEAGVKNLVVEAWFGAYGPAGVPALEVGILNREITAAIQAPDVAARLYSAGFLPMPMTPAQIAELSASSEESWGQLIKSMGIKPQ